MTTHKPVVVFTYSAPFGHFLRAEASASALSYPVPPRTALLGMIGAVLGLEKDTPLAAEIALMGAAPRTHWHRAKLRKEMPPPLERTIKKGAKGSDGSPEKPTLIPQEWLLEPRFTIVAHLPDHHDLLLERLQQRSWHYPPSMGLSEMSANLEFVAQANAVPLTAAQVLCNSLVRQDHAEFDVKDALQQGLALAVTPLRLPRECSFERVFTHCNYLFERHAKAIPVKTDAAYSLTWAEQTRAVMFL
jgi:CRISPR-associated protein Cas5h